MERILWEQFNKSFDDLYFPTIIRQQKSNDFATLVQGNMSVKQYATKFMELGGLSHTLFH